MSRPAETASAPSLERVLGLVYRASTSRDALFGVWHLWLDDELQAEATRRAADSMQRVSVTRTDTWGEPRDGASTTATTIAVWRDREGRLREERFDPDGALLSVVVRGRSHWHRIDGERVVTEESAGGETVYLPPWALTPLPLLSVLELEDAASEQAYGEVEAVYVRAAIRPPQRPDPTYLMLGAADSVELAFESSGGVVARTTLAADGRPYLDLTLRVVDYGREPPTALVDDDFVSLLGPEDRLRLA